MKRNNKALIITLITVITVLFTGTVSFADDGIDYVKGRPLTEEEIAQQQALEPVLKELPRFDDKLIVVETPDSSLKQNRGVSFESYYDMRQQSYSDVIKVKYQGNTGLCWAFGTTTAAEISRAKQLADRGENVSFYQFSPFHIGYFMYNRVNDPLGKTGSDKNISQDNYKDSGGNSYMTLHVLSGWNGFANEEKITPGKSSYDSALAYDNDYVIEYAELITDGYQSASNEAIKEAVKENGSVVVDMYYNEEFFNRDTSAYITSKDARYGNHIVTIVGWDDDFSKENFNNEPLNDGAWIVQNSYGPEWGDYGYMYISYEDSSLACPMAVKVVPEYTYDYNYQYDGNANPEEVLLESGTKVANVFTVPSTTETQTLKSVGFSTLTEDSVDYKIEIYTGVSGTSNPENGTKACSFNVNADNEGYFTFEVPSTVELVPGSKYSVVVTPMNDTYFGAERDGDYGWIKFESGHAKGRSFIYDRGWEDLYSYDTCVRIKGLTVESKPIDISNATVTLPYSSYSYSGNARKPLPTVKYNGRYLKKDIDYTLEYGENIYPGEGYVYINGTGDFEGKLTKSFYIAKASSLSVKSYGTNSLTLKWSANNNVDGYKVYQYTSNGYKCVKTVEGDDTTSTTIKNLTAGKGYTFRVSSYVDEYEGVRSDKLSAPAKPNKGSVKKLTTGSSHYVKATWYKRTGSGYQVKRATNSKFTTNVKTYKITSSGTLSKKMTGLKKGKTYYVKVRAYKTYGGKTAYGPWSGYKKIKCK